MSRLQNFMRSLHGRRRAYSKPLFVAGVAAFAIGCLVSFRQLDFSLIDLHEAPLGMAALLVIPSLLYGGIGLSLLARSAGASVALARATVVSAYAYLAELLPIPGGAIVRAGFLVGAGETVHRSTTLVIATAVLWMALGMTGAGLTLLSSFANLAGPVMATGLGISFAITLWLWRISNVTTALQTLAHRIFGIVLISVRLHFAFAALGTPVGLPAALPFVLAIILGSASSIAPAGLGISETLAALAATATSYPPEVAFLAVGLDRLLCLTGCALLAFGAQLVKRVGPWSRRIGLFTDLKEG